MDIGQIAVLMEIVPGCLSDQCRCNMTDYGYKNFICTRFILWKDGSKQIVLCVEIGRSCVSEISVRLNKTDLSIMHEWENYVYHLSDPKSMRNAKVKILELYNLHKNGPLIERDEYDLEIS